MAGAPIVPAPGELSGHNWRALLRVGRVTAVLSNLDQAPEVFIPAIVLGELFFGAAKSGRASENTAKVERFATDRSILSCELHVAREYGR